ncbi:tRNA (adenosine(37)-N6)-threonylcarbamoyltransferase complex dimerization subunit type 1 TsaB [Novosphingobium sp.]|uniref:tRNA (adenosine(37)-N6)-threonylcarbamoyltransferase complex dimerization subunit type 1 TsaB n=1 Tax=Novosphingobium sp. TaxID=1874826 RepID=UPI003340ACDF
MTRILVIDSATEACSVALFDDGAADTMLVAGEWAELGRGHAERLVPMIAGLPASGRADRIMVNLGPGSFTGIRVGLAAARALGLAWGVPVGGYGCLDLVAAMAHAAQPGQAIDVVMSGGHGEWFFQPFAATGAAIAALASLSPPAVLARSAAACVAGSQAHAVAAHTGAQALDIRPDARAFARLDRAAWCDDISPVYGRAPDAKVAVARAPVAKTGRAKTGPGAPRAA